MKNNNKLSFNRFLPLCLIMAIMLSGNVFAADTTPRRVTQAELDAEIATRQTTDTSLQSADTAEAATRQNADTALQNNLNNAVAAQAAINADQNTTIQALQSALSQAQTDIANLKALIPPPPKQIGDHFGGGIVFSVDATGQHGLIAALADLTDGVDTGIPWYNGVYKVTGATGDGIGAGASNTAIIIAAQAADNPTGIFAAKAAADFSVQEDGVTPCTGTVDEICYGDWYLPSKHELNLLYQQQAVVGGFTAVYYWSSTEGDADLAWSQFFGHGGQYTYGKTYTFRVRAVRAF